MTAAAPTPSTNFLFWDSPPPPPLARQPACSSAFPLSIPFLKFRKWSPSLDPDARAYQGVPIRNSELCRLFAIPECALAES